jgi:Mce-associated membrane protein
VRTARTVGEQPARAGQRPAPAGGRPRGWRGLLALFAASALLALAGAGLVVASLRVRASPAAANRALTDPAATRQVIRVISADVTRIFSYSYADMPATRRAARRVLTGSAAAQYGRLFSQLGSAAGERLTVETRVAHAGVIRLSSDTAQLLMFLDQTATRGQAEDGATPYHAQLAVTVRLRAGQWWITSIQAR